MARRLVRKIRDELTILSAHATPYVTFALHEKNEWSSEPDEPDRSGPEYRIRPALLRNSAYLSDAPVLRTRGLYAFVMQPRSELQRADVPPGPSA